MSLGTTQEWLGAVIVCNWYLERLSISNFTTTAFITEYWQGKMPDLMYFLVCLISEKTYCCPNHYDFRNKSGVDWCCCFLQLVSGEIEYIPLDYNCFRNWVLARTDVRFDIFTGSDPSQNILVPTPLWVWEPQRGGLMVDSFAIGIWIDWVYPTWLQLLPSLILGKEWCQIWYIHWFWSISLLAIWI